MYEQFSGGISFDRFHDIEALQIFELAHAWVEKREPVFDFSPGRVLSADPDEWNERFFITVGDNPFVDEVEIENSREAVHQGIARIFHDIWAVEKRSFEYWYDLERKSHQKNLAKMAMRAMTERNKAAAAMLSVAEPGIDLVSKMLPSEAENLLNGVLDIFSRSEDGGIRPKSESTELMKSFAIANQRAEAPFNKLEAMMYAVIAMRAAGFRWSRI
jgi:hypothetical protein